MGYTKHVILGKVWDGKSQKTDRAGYHAEQFLSRLPAEALAQGGDGCVVHDGVGVNAQIPGTLQKVDRLQTAKSLRMNF